ncbi:hypothetical protein HZH66_010190 [Vespula vulgaris]|uniref:Uncharacterized protein n=1 Tax=Vespula vulgaris TaxID=7454 RepID=A0A834JHY0_VESVU|nr:hypothetical protein HZH66_010190 [Vespula vulgaris]
MEDAQFTPATPPANSRALNFNDSRRRNLLPSKNRLFLKRVKTQIFQHSDTAAEKEKKKKGRKKKAVAATEESRFLTDRQQPLRREVPRMGHNIRIVRNAKIAN